MLKRKQLFCSLFVIILLFVSTTIRAQNDYSVSHAETGDIETYARNESPAKDLKPPGNLPEKIADIKRKIAATPNDAFLYNRLSILYFYSERYDDSVKELKKAVELQPHPQLYLNLSVLYDRLNRFSKSFDAVKQSLELDSANVEAIEQLCGLYVVSKEVKKASLCFKDLVEKSPDLPEYYSSYGMSLIHLDQNKESLKFLRKAVNRFPSDSAVNNAFGLALYNNKKYEESAKVFKDILAVNPEIAEARYNLVVAQLKLNKKTAAMKNYFTLKNSGNPLAKKLYKLIYGDKIIFVEDYKR